MCLLLAEFLRNTLNLSALQRIPLADELALVDRFLDIEQVRFGSRLQVTRAIDDGAQRCLVPPLILQPLIENAVGHGIAALLDGGVITLSVVLRGERLSIAIENPRDPDPSVVRHVVSDWTMSAADSRRRSGEPRDSRRASIRAGSVSTSISLASGQIDRDDERSLNEGRAARHLLKLSRSQ